MKKKVMISQPMAGKSKEEIKTARELVIKKLEMMGYEVVNTYFDNGWRVGSGLEPCGIINTPLYFLSQAITCMSECDAVYFCNGFSTTRGCLVEHECACFYGLDVIYESPDEIKDLELAVETGWITIRDGCIMPEEDEFEILTPVMVTYWDKTFDIDDPDGYGTMEASYSVDDGHFYFSDPYNTFEKDSDFPYQFVKRFDDNGMKVMAWMPYPEPVPFYKK